LFLVIFQVAFGGFVGGQIQTTIFLPKTTCVTGTKGSQYHAWHFDEMESHQLFAWAGLEP
jgi:hypothetical protein